MFGQAISLDNTFRRSHITDTALLCRKCLLLRNSTSHDREANQDPRRFNNNMINILLLHHPTYLHSPFFHQRFLQFVTLKNESLFCSKKRETKNNINDEDYFEMKSESLRCFKFMTIAKCFLIILRFWA
jgi:hypothetical protein